MKIKKYFVGFVASTMLVSTCYCIKPVEAIDFSKDEAKYMSLCASGKLTNSNKKTCEEFNSYLKAKNKKLRLYTKTGGEIYPAPVFLYLNRHSFHTVLQFK